MAVGDIPGFKKNAQNTYDEVLLNSEFGGSVESGTAQGQLLMWDVASTPDKWIHTTNLILTDGEDTMKLENNGAHGLKIYIDEEDIPSVDLHCCETPFIKGTQQGDGLSVIVANDPELDTLGFFGNIGIAQPTITKLATGATLNDTIAKVNSLLDILGNVENEGFGLLMCSPTTPTLVSAVTSEDGYDIILTFSEHMDSGITGEEFDIHSGATHKVVDSVNVVGEVVTITVTVPVANGETWVNTYVSGTDPVYSALGVLLASITDGAITNSVPGEYVYCTGGDITQDGDYRVHTFLTSGTLVVETGGDVEVLVVAGGGGGCLGGGGAGGVLYDDVFAITTDSSPYTVTVGAGGTGSVDTNPSGNGANSVFGTLTAIGGGAGAYNGGTYHGADGGSGGGGLDGTRAPSPGSGTTGQGHDGGDGNYASSPYPDGGGGGAGSVGGNGSVSHSGNGGSGLDYSNEFGTDVGENGWFAGGGGGGSYYQGTGGTAEHGGGSGATNDNSGENGTANTGGGGGGGYMSKTGGSGGSGIVIIRYYHPS